MNYSTKQIRLFAVFFSLLLSFFMFITDDIINRDGILYVEVAQAYINGGLAAAFQVFDWPFFPILIAYIHKTSSLSIESSAFFLNGLLFALFVDSILNISNKILPNIRQLTIAAILILCFSVLNEYRDFIIRDIGYWAFCSLSLYRFMIFLERPTFRNAIFWQLAITMAVLFRIEGIVILLGLPLYYFTTHHPKQAFLYYVRLNFLFFIGFVLILFLFFPKLNINEGVLSASTSLLHFETYATALNHNMKIMETLILNKFSEDYSGLILISGLLVMLTYKLIKGLSITYLGIFAYSLWQNRASQKSEFLRLFVFFAALNITILIVFVLARYFISTRYCMMALISLLLLMIPRLCAIIEDFWLRKNKLALTFISLLLFVGLIDSVTSSRSKSYIKNTAIWASKNLPKNSTILTDNQFIEYYVKGHRHNAAISLDDLSLYPKYDYLIVIEKRKQQALKEKLTTMNIESIFNLSSKRGDKATVYKILPTNSN